MPEFSIDVTSNADDVAAILTEVGDVVLRESGIAAANRTMQQVQTRGGRQVTAETGIPSREFRKRMKLYRANRSRQFARLFVGVLAIAAIKLGARQTKSGVTFRGGGSRTKAQGAFIQTMPSGHVGVFKRQGATRLPIDEVKVEFASNATRIFRNLIATFAPGKFREIFNREFQFRTQRAIDKRQ